MTFGQNNTKELKAIIGEIKLSEILSAFNYIDNNGIPSKRGADTCYFIYNSVQYPVKLVTEIINNVIKNNTKQLSPAEHDPWQDAPLYDDIDFPDDIILITPYNNSGRKCVEQFRQELLDNFTNLNIIDVNTNYTKIEKNNKNIAEIHFLNKRDNQFKILVNYDLLPKEMTTTIKKSIKGFRKVPDSHKWTLNGEYYVTTNPQTVKFAIKAINAIIENNNFDQISTKFWLYAAGEKSYKWNEFYKEGIMALGWDNLGNLTKFHSQDEIVRAMQKSDLKDSYPKNDSKANWEFANEMNIGDIVYVKKGIDPILLGRGVVASDYIYDDTRNEYKSIRKVNWTHNGIYHVDFNELDIKQWNQKTLTDISENKYKDFSKKIEKIFNDKANEDKNMCSQSLNQILYGPPGTGKTYNTVIKAIEITNPELIQRDENGDVINYDVLKQEFDELKKQGQIEFVTFHQSYSYEEFVEGIKPEIPQWNAEGSTLKYVGKDGILKTIAKKALYAHLNISQPEDDKFKNIIKYFIDDNFEGSKFKTQYSEFEIVRYTQTAIIVEPCNGKTEYNLTFNNLEKLYRNKQDVKTRKDIEQILGWKGLSTYYLAILNKLKNYSEKNIINIQTTSNEETIIIKSIDDYLQEYYEGKLSLKENPKKYILIIDEINRGNISKIFGELITLIETDKRIGNKYEARTTLPYSKKQFGIPKNLYIIGTMNTSDRSIASIDIALRRRFKFVEMMPRPELVADFGCGFQSIFDKLNTKIKILLDRDHQIGHSYFINTKYANADTNILKEIWFSEIIPLLNEYFYCDWEKLKLVIPGFIKEITIPEELKNDCEDSMYEFKTPNEVKDFVGALKQDKFKQED